MYATYFALERPLDKETTVEVLEAASAVIGKCLDHFHTIEPTAWLLMSRTIEVGTKLTAEMGRWESAVKFVESPDE